MAIKEYRQAAGLTQKQLSELFNPPIPVDTIKNWDSGRRAPSEWEKNLIIEKIKDYQDGIARVVLTQEEISKIMTALTVVKMEAKESIEKTKSQNGKKLCESTAKEWEDAQFEIGLKLGYYTKPEDVPQKENAEDLMMEFLKS